MATTILNSPSPFPSSLLLPKHSSTHHHQHRSPSFKAYTSLSLIEPQSFTPIPISPNLLKSNPNSQHSSPPNENLTVSSHNYQYLLQLSLSCNDISIAKSVHASIIKNGEKTQLFNTLIATYLKFRSFRDAYKCFSTLSSPDVVSYTTMMSAYAKSNRESEAVKLFFEMRCAGIELNEFSFVAILTVCIRLFDLRFGEQIHALGVKLDYCGFTYVCNALMGLYAKCGRVDRSIQLFDEMPQRDLASWNTVISGLVKLTEYEGAFEFFCKMVRVDEFKVDQFSLSTILVACAESHYYLKGRECHAHALKVGLGSNTTVNNALIGFYTKCGSVQNVVGLFERLPQKDVITWTGMVIAYMEFGMVELAVKTFARIPGKNCISYNALLAGLYQNGEGFQALRLFQGMLERGLELSEFSLTSIVNACAVLAEVDISKQIHGFVTKFGFGSNPWIEAALLDMCTRCGRIDDAEKMFNQWSYKQNFSMVWTSMICGHARSGQPVKAASLFCRMHADGNVVIDEFASTAVLGVCGSLGSHNLGKQIHCYAYKKGFLSDLGVCNAIISMYAKCGDMEDSVKCFNLMPNHDVVSWNSLISGHLLHRRGEKALALWSEMGHAGVEPDSLTCSLILSAYRYTTENLLDDCHNLFNSMTRKFCIEPTSDHYASMVGVLGYWGYYNEAEELIGSMPFEPDNTVWRALLDSCRLRSNTKLGKKVIERIVAVEPQDASTYILVSNLYAASGRWNCFERVKKEMREKGFRKNPNRSWVIHGNKVHAFYARDKSHPESKEIYAGLNELIPRCIRVGYEPDTSYVLQDVERHQKTEFLFYHSAKLAVTYGILYTKSVQVVKNIHLCGDCHSFFKYASSVLGREISFRDASGFHIFRNGECSCRDYW